MVRLRWIPDCAGTVKASFHIPLLSQHNLGSISGTQATCPSHFPCTLGLSVACAYGHVEISICNPFLGLLKMHMVYTQT